MKNKWLIILMGLALFGCSCQISFEKALTEDYLSKPLVEYQGRDNNLKALSAEEKTQLFYASFYQKNLPLAEYYLSIGAVIKVDMDGGCFAQNLLGENLVPKNKNKERKEFLSKNRKQEYEDFLFSAVSYQESILALRIDRVDNSRNITVLNHLFNQYDEIDKREKLLDLVENVNVPDSSGRNVVIAYIDEHYNTLDRNAHLEVLIKKGLDINHQDNQGKTALHYAANDCNIPVIRMLLENGADKTVEENLNHFTPYDATVEYENGLVRFGTEEEKKEGFLELKEARELLKTSNSQFAYPDFKWKVMPLSDHP